MPLKVMIVDDSVIWRKVLCEMVAGMEGVSEASMAPNGAIGLQKIEQSPVDLVLLDVNMPVMDGIETLRQLRQRFPATEVVMISGLAEDAVRAAVEALQIGAIELIRKPEGADAGINSETLKKELSLVFNIVQTRRAVSRALGPHPLTPPPAQTPALARALPRSFGLVVIGISTGGPQALHTLLPQLPGNFPVPILIVQHMPPKFTAALAADLARKSRLQVIEASENLPLAPGRAILARGGAHLVIRKEAGGLVVGLTDGPAENFCKPSVDVLFRSAATWFGDRGVLAVVMTGMGNDGLAGVRALKRKGCVCLTQSAETCVVYGMPRVVDEAGLSDESVALPEIGKRVVELVM